MNRRPKKRIPAVLLFFAFLLPQSSFAAPANKLISKNMKWKVAQTTHFDVYYYAGGEKMLAQVSASLERAYSHVVPLLGVKIPGRSKFFLYLNHNDFEQTNIVDIGEGTGGVTEAFKDRFLVFNDGSRTWLDHVVAHEFTHVCQFAVLYGGFWRSVRLIKSVLYPLWFMEGMAEFGSQEIDDVQKDMVLRDAMTSGLWMPLAMLHGFNHVKPHQVTLAYKTGNAAVLYIAEQYGKDKVGLLLKDISEKFDIGSSLQEVLGLNLGELDKKFQEEMKEKYEEQSEGTKEPEAYGEALTKPDNLYPVFNSNPAFFPDGNTLAYLSDKEGFTELYVYDIALGRPKALDIQRRFPSQIENISRAGSALSISPDGSKILFTGERHQRDFIYVYDLKRDKLSRLSYPLDGVASPQYSPDGKRILFVGMKDGKNDLYLSNVNGRELKNLTNSEEDEKDSRFLNDRSVVFSREPLMKKGDKYGRDLWSRDLQTGKERRLTDLEGDEMQPAVSPSGKEIVFVGEQDGIDNLYKISTDGGRPVQWTHVIGGNFYPAYRPNGSDVTFVSHRRGEQHIYLAKDISAPQEVPLKIIPSAAVKGEVVSSTASVSADVDVILRPGKPYKLRASTDFFFPIFYYSSADGLFLSAYWQASEMLGNHQIQAAVTYASLYDFLNYQVFYSYLRFRTQVTLGFIGDTSQSVFLTTRELRREDAQFLALTYPLSRFDEVQVQGLTTQRRVQFDDDDFVTSRFAGRENVGSLTFKRDVSQGRYLQTTSGYRVIASMQESNKFWNSSLDYRDVFLTLHGFLPVHRESTVALRLYGGGSFGGDKQFFRTGGSDLLRGFGRFDTQSAASNFVISNLEFRFPIFFNTNYHVWFFFPDFLFKNVYGVIFTDNGVLWDRRQDLQDYRAGDIRNSVGLGVRVEAFVLQAFPIILQVDWARRTGDGEQVFYLGLGPTF